MKPVIFQTVISFRWMITSQWGFWKCTEFWCKSHTSNAIKLPCIHRLLKYSMLPQNVSFLNHVERKSPPKIWQRFKKIIHKTPQHVSNRIPCSTTELNWSRLFCISEYIAPMVCAVKLWIREIKSSLFICHRQKCGKIQLQSIMPIEPVDVSRIAPCRYWIERENFWFTMYAFGTRIKDYFYVCVAQWAASWMNSDWMNVSLGS